MNSTSTQSDILRHVLLALLALALVFLNFGHSSAVFAAGGRVVVTGTSICGDPVTPSSGDHFACHACRPQAVVLPSPPAAATPTCFVAEPVVYAGAVRAHHINVRPGIGNARAPPAV